MLSSLSHFNFNTSIHICRSLFWNISCCYIHWSLVWIPLYPEQFNLAPSYNDRICECNIIILLIHLPDSKSCILVNLQFAQRPHLQHKLWFTNCFTVLAAEISIKLYLISFLLFCSYMPISGFQGVLSGFLVGIKQIIPDQELSLLKIKAKVINLDFGKSFVK